MSKPIIPMVSPVLQRAAVTRCGIVFRSVAIAPEPFSIQRSRGIRHSWWKLPRMLRAPPARVAAMSEVIITVRGEHEARIAPEQGVAHISVRSEGPERGAVVERIAAVSTPLRDDLTARKTAGTVVEWSSQRVSVWSNRPWNTEGKQLAPVHYASVSVTATFDDFAALSWWVGDVAARDGVQVESVQWRLTPATRKATEADVAANAVRVAVDRATAYAAAIGLSAVTPLEIADLGLLTHESASAGPEPEMMKAVRGMAAMDSAGAAPTVEFEPEDIVVTAAVEARFTAH